MSSIKQGVEGVPGGLPRDSDPPLECVFDQPMRYRVRSSHQIQSMKTIQLLTAAILCCLTTGCLRYELPEPSGSGCGGPRADLQNNVHKFPGTLRADFDSLRWIAQVPVCLVNCDKRVDYSFLSSQTRQGVFPAQITFLRKYSNAHVLAADSTNTCPFVDVRQRLRFDILDHSVGAFNTFDPASVKYFDNTRSKGYELDTTTSNSFRVTAHVERGSLRFFEGTFDFRLVNEQDASDTLRVSNAQFTVAFESI